MVGAAAALVAAVADAEVGFGKPVVIAKEDRARAGVVMIDVASPDTADIAWVDASGGTRYTRWEGAKADTNGGLVADGEQVCGLTHNVLGVGRGAKGVVRIGANNSKRILEWTRGDDGKWTSSDTGVVCKQYYGQVAGYAVSRKNGVGTFLVLSEQNQMVLASRTPGVVGPSGGDKDKAAGWDTKVLAEKLDDMVRSSLAVTSAGEPVVAYQSLKAPSKAVAGKIASLGDLGDQSNSWYPLAIAPDENGKLHAVVALNIGAINYYSSKNGGKTWVADASIAKSSSYGDGSYLAMAVAPNGNRLAALVPTGAKGVSLATSKDHGNSWELQTLPGFVGPRAALAFDKAGTLYVAYFNGEDKQLVLLKSEKW